MKRAQARLARVVVATALFFACSGWLDGIRSRAQSGNRLYFRGRYEEAEKAYGQGLVDYPSSDVLHFNMAAAQYQQGKYQDAIQSLDQVRAEDTSRVAAQVAYNRGNAQFKLAGKSEGADLPAALALYAQALASYRRAMSLDPADVDAKFNHELAERKMLALKEKLEEEKRKKEEEGRQSEPGEKEEAGRPKEQAEEPGGENDEERGAQDGKQEPQEAAAEGSQGQAGEPEQGEKNERGTMSGGERSQESMSPQEAQALIGAAKGEELSAGDLSQRLLGAAGLGEPLKDW